MYILTYKKFTLKLKNIKTYNTIIKYFISLNLKCFTVLYCIKKNNEKL